MNLVGNISGATTKSTNSDLEATGIPESNAEQGKGNRLYAKQILTRQAIPDASKAVSKINSSQSENKSKINDTFSKSTEANSTVQYHSPIRNISDIDPFHISKNTDEQAFIEKIKSQPDLDLVNTKNFQGQSLLGQAIINHKNEIVNYLLSQNQIDLEQPHLRLTPLMAAAYVNNVEAAKMLVKAGADISTQFTSTDNVVYTAITKALQNTDQQNTLANTLINELPEKDKQECIDEELRIACAQGKSDIATFLISRHNANVFAKDSTGRTALSKASSNNQKSTTELIFKYIISKLSEIEKTEGTQARKKQAIEVAASMARQSNLKDFIAFVEYEKINVNKESNAGSLLFLAAGFGQIDHVKYLVNEKNAEIDFECGHTTILENAAEAGHQETVDFLLSKFDPLNRTIKAQDCFVSAAKLGKIGLIKHLLNKYSLFVNKKNRDGFTALYLACGWGKLETVKYLIKEHRVQISKTGRNDLLPIANAAAYGHVEVVDFLIKSALGPLKKEFSAECFVTAARYGENEVLKYLHEQDPTLINSAEDDDEDSALVLASMFGHLSTVKYLVAKGADIDDDMKALSSAAKNLHEEVVRYLLTQYSEAERESNAQECAALLIKQEKSCISLFNHLVSNEITNLNERMNDKTLFDRAVAENKFDYVQALTNRGCEITFNGFRSCKSEKIFKHVIEHLPSKDVLQIGRFFNSSIRSLESRRYLARLMLLRYYVGSSDPNLFIVDVMKAFRALKNNCFVPEACNISNSQILLESLEKAIISANTDSFHSLLEQIQEKNYPSELLTFGRHSLIRCTFIALSRSYVSEDVILNLIAMGANPKTILDNDNGLKEATELSLSNNSYEFLNEIGDRAELENENALIEKVHQAYQKYLANPVANMRSVDLFDTTRATKKPRLG